MKEHTMIEEITLAIMNRCTSPDGSVDLDVNEIVEALIFVAAWFAALDQELSSPAACEVYAAAATEAMAEQIALSRTAHAKNGTDGLLSGWSIQ